MRILQLTDLYPPAVGGTEQHVATLTRRLASSGHEVTVVTLANADAPRFEALDRVQVRRLDGWSRVLPGADPTGRRRFQPPVPDPGIVRQLTRILAAEQPDVVHAHGWLVFSYLPLAGATAPPLVTSLHDYGLVCAKKGFVTADERPCSGPALAKCLRCAGAHYGWARGTALVGALRCTARLSARTRCFVANSEAVARSARTAMPRGEVRVIPPYLADRSPLPPGRPAFVPPAGDYVCFAGALTRYKGLHVLLDAYRRLERPVPLVLAGARRGERIPHLPEGVTLATDVAHVEVLRAFTHSVAAVVPSTYPEPFGLTAVEAMAAGRPVVASDLGGLREVVRDGETGLLVPPADPDALATALQTLLDDREQATRLGAAGRARAALLDGGARIEALYDELRWCPTTPTRRRTTPSPAPATT